MAHLAIAQHTSSPAASSFLHSGSHLPLDIAVPVIVVVILIKVVYSRMRGRPALGGEILVRCRRGHLFRTYWSPLGSFTAIRLGSARFQHCPVGDHWSLVRPVNEAELTDADRFIVEQNRDKLSP
jgi:hypothetical protein